jgi:hypothetical protein
MVAGPNGDDALAIRLLDLELVKSERQRGFAIRGLDGTDVSGSGATHAIDQPLGDLGGLTGRGISSTHKKIVAIPRLQPQSLDCVPRLFPCCRHDPAQSAPRGDPAGLEGAVLAYRRVYRVTPEDRFARAAAFEAFREVLPEMPEELAKVEANHAIAFAAANYAE